MVKANHALSNSALFANFWSRFVYVLGQFPNCFRLMSGWNNEIYTFYIYIWIIIAERTKSILAQRSFRFFKTLANGTLAKRRVDETTVHPKIEQAKERLCWQGALSNDTSYLELSLTFVTVWMKPERITSTQLKTPYQAELFTIAIW